VSSIGVCRLGEVMERAQVNGVKVCLFCLSTPTVKSRIHFFPSAGNTGGHHPVLCQVTVFGKGIERRSVQLDGGRLNQPDGIRLEDAFPALNLEATGLYGVEMILTCPQSRVSLLNSRVVIEMVSPQFALAYSAAPCRALDASEVNSPLNVKPNAAKAIGIGINDASMSSSLVLVNAGEEIFRPDFSHATTSADASFPIGTVGPGSVVEVPLDDTLCKAGMLRQSLWGETRVEKVWSETLPELDSVAGYILYRDPVTRRPLSVCAL
jgi:hypothetical protein